jgi:hypothetical protein
VHAHEELVSGDIARLGDGVDAEGAFAGERGVDGRGRRDIVKNLLVGHCDRLLVATKERKYGVERGKRMVKVSQL